MVESWIADKENQVRSDDYGRDLSSVQTLLAKQVRMQLLAYLCILVFFFFCSAKLSVTVAKPVCRIAFSSHQRFSVHLLDVKFQVAETILLNVQLTMLSVCFVHCSVTLICIV